MTLERLQAKAISRGGLCLAKEGDKISTDSKCQWQCSKGHIWEAKINNVIHLNRWCMACSGHAPLTIDTLINHAQSKGGKCLSTIYTNVDSKYQWECSRGHRWIAEASNVLHNKNWCPNCCFTFPKTLEYIQQKAIEKGGRCISDNYKGMLAKYEWECAKGHRWVGNANNVVNHGHWCRYCMRQQSKPQDKLYEYIKEMYPLAQCNVTSLLPNKRFELDIYIPNLKKAVEFDGDFWHSSEKVRERDARKDEQCKIVGIALLRVKESEYNSQRDIVLKNLKEFLNQDASLEKPPSQNESS